MVVKGKNCQIDKDAIIGYPPLRKIANRKLIIGDFAICLGGSIIYLGSRIGAHLFIGHHAVIREENIIGDNFKLYGNSTVDYNCAIANNVKVHHNVYIAQFSIIEEDVFIGPGSIFANDLHPGCIMSRKCLKGPHLRRGCQIGGNCVILPDITVGKHALIGAGSVVTKDIPDFAIAWGNPAVVHGDIKKLTCKKKILKHYIKIGLPK